MEDISGFGLKVIVEALITFPAGIVITQFADDVDPFDIPSIQIADKGMGLNGDLITWAKASPINVTLGVVPGGTDDDLLSILLATNRVGRGKIAVPDIINIVGIYPDGHTVQLINGKMTDGMPGNSVASAGRLKSKQYTFTFENTTQS